MLTHRSKQRVRNPEISELLDEQSDCWARRSRVSVERLLARHPEIADHPTARLELIYHEIVLRRNASEVFDIGVYFDKYPSLADELEKLLAIDGLGFDDAQSHTRSDEMKSETGEFTSSGTSPSSQKADGSPVEIEGYEIITELGRGGMGIVYKARQISPNRVCAIKILLNPIGHSPVMLARFSNEARMLASLDHPHIVQVFNSGVSRSWPYLVMEFVEGGSVDHKLDGTPWNARRAAEMIEPIARAIAEAHRRQIVHRDVKPGNILLDARGLPKIADFGLAKSLLENQGLTETGCLIGTAAYMAPEQADGAAKKITHRVDIYSLGAVLYRITTGRLPFQAVNLLTIIDQIKNIDPIAPRRLVPDLPVDLETITLKCLQKNPANRYQSADDLADDLGRFLRGEPIDAQPVRRLEQVWRWCLRNRRVAAMVVVSILVFAAAAVISVCWALIADAERNSALLANQRSIDAIEQFFVVAPDALRSDDLREQRSQLVETGLKLSDDLARYSENGVSVLARAERVRSLQVKALMLHESGRPLEAVAAARKSVAAAEELDHREHSTAFTRFVLAYALERLGKVDPNRPTAKSATVRAVAILEPDMDASPIPSWNSLHVFLEANYNLGYLEAEDQRFDEAVSALQKGLAACRRRIDRTNDSQEWLGWRAQYQRYLCRLLPKRTSDGKGFEEAIAAGRHAVDDYLALLEREIDSFQYNIDLAWSRDELGLVFQAARKWEEAIVQQEAARFQLKAAAGKFKFTAAQTIQIYQRLTLTNENLCFSYKSANNRRFNALEREVTMETRDVCDKLAMIVKLPIDQLKIQACACYEEAEFQAIDGAKPDVNLLKAAERHFEELLTISKDDLEAKCYLVVVRVTLAHELIRLGRITEAEAYHQITTKSIDGEYAAFGRVAGHFSDAAKTIDKRDPQCVSKAMSDRRTWYIQQAKAMFLHGMSYGISGPVGPILRAWSTRLPTPTAK